MNVGNDEPRVLSRGLWGTILYALAAYLLFAHGCHGTADTDLRIVISESSSATAGR